MRLRRPFYYSQSELSDQIGNIADLMKLREKSMQLAILENKSATAGKHNVYLKELDQFDTNIMVANEVLGIMLEKNVKGKK